MKPGGGMVPASGKVPNKFSTGKRRFLPAGILTKLQNLSKQLRRVADTIDAIIRGIGL